MRNMHPDAEVVSAGTKPEEQVNPLAIKVMAEIGLDISSHTPKLVDQFINDSFDYLITVCDHAKEVCPVFVGIVKNRLHIGFIDPADARGTDEEKLIVYREVRDQIKFQFETKLSNL